MNEIEIIRRQLDTERQHFAEVAAACTAVPAVTISGPWGQACAEYLAFAVTRLETDAADRLQTELEAARGADRSSSGERWGAFLSSLEAQLRRRSKVLDDLAARNPSVAQWRSVSRIDADSILRERTLYGRVQSAQPARANGPAPGCA